MAENSRFAEELNKILKETSMSPEEAVLEFKKHGLPVPLHTFNYWLQGYFLPRSESAFQLIAMLEGVYGITDSRFSDALLEDLSSGASFVPGEAGDDDFQSALPPNIGHKIDPYLDEAGKTIDWEANLIQKVVRDEVILNADRTYSRHTATILARIPAVPNPTFVFQLLYEPGARPGTESHFYNVTGMSLRKQEIYEQDDMIICSTLFALPDDVVPGDLHTLSYSWDESSDKPRYKEAERYLPWILDFYSCKITFEGGIPEDIRYATFELYDDEEVEVPCDIPIVRSGNTVSMSAKNFGNLVGAFCSSVPA
ncbi:MAG: hypothetical protein IKS49_00990 [Actinomycetaceae bacterium]|nr:hypothetical protein [Actinomycetaceae bacterium]